MFANAVSLDVTLLRLYENTTGNFQDSDELRNIRDSIKGEKRLQRSFFKGLLLSPEGIGFLFRIKILQILSKTR